MTAGWLEVSVLADREAVEAVSAVFAEYAYAGGVAIEEDITPSVDGEGFAYNLDRPVRVKAYVAVDDQSGERVEQLRRALDHLSFIRPIQPLTLRHVAEEDWANAWKEHYHVLHIGRRVVIVPSWREYAPNPGEVTIRLDPGMAFGTGLHPTTRGCLEVLENIISPGMSVLDVGTGSGILAIAAAQMGARPVLAVEIDPVAVSAARANMVMNHLESVIEVRQGSVPLTHETAQFDVVVANIIARVIADLSRPLAASLRPGGMLIASGIIYERLDMVVDALAQAGLSLERCDADGDWRTLTLTCPPV